MITLALQIFLLLLSAFLVGCMVGCLLKRALHGSRPVPAGAGRPVSVAPPLVARPTATETARFEKALTGSQAAAAPEHREPVVEVRRRAPEPIVAPAAAPVVAAPAVPALDEVAPAEIEIVKAEAPAPVVPSAPPPPPPPPVAEAPARAPVEIASSDPAALASYAAIAAASAAAVRTDLAGTAPSEPDSEAPEPDVPEPEAPEPQAPQPAAAEPFVAKAASAAEVGQPVPAPEPREPLPADDLKRIRGIDRTVEGRLNGLGVHRFDDIAAWSADDVMRFNQSLGFIGRIEQENWIEQAQILARGGDTDYSLRQQIAQSTAAAGVAAAAAGGAASAADQVSAGPDRFTRIIGIDPDTERILHDMGVSRYAEIAHWTSSDIEQVERVLNRPGRVGLDNWVEQARVLARYAGGTEAARPVHPAEAIGEPGDAPATEAPPSAPTPAASRPDLAGLRSVRSQALRGDAGAPGERIDDLKRIRGIGVLIERRLNALGIVGYEQIANWTGADIDRVSSTLDFKGRIERENWIEQARILASGGQTEFSRRVDRGEVESGRDG